MAWALFVTPASLFFEWMAGGGGMVGGGVERKVIIIIIIIILYLYTKSYHFTWSS